MWNLQEDIRPSADLRNHYNEISKLCRELRQPIHITVNGRNDTVLLGETDYAQMKAELDLLRMLADAEEDVSSGHVAPVEDTLSDIRSRLLARKNR